jgi:hypothetical protein
MNPRIVTLALALAAVLNAGRAAAEEPPAFGVIKGPGAEAAKAQALAWLKTAKADALPQGETLWGQADDRPLIERVADTLALGDAEAGKLIATLRDPAAAVPEGVPAFLKDTKRAPFLRTNLTLYFAKVLATRRAYEETLDALKIVRPEQVVDPASYYFFKAVAENKLRHKDEGLAAVHRLLTSVPDAPERYVVLATLMKSEMEAWNDDLGDINRRMREVEDRLEIARGGPKTQQKQKEILDKLDKKIDDIEKQLQQMQAVAGAAPQSMEPAQDTRIIGGAGEGKVDKKKLQKTAEIWGRMPEKDRVKALEAIGREYPPHYREAIEEYLRKSAAAQGK